MNLVLVIQQIDSVRQKPQRHFGRKSGQGHEIMAIIQFTHINALGPAANQGLDRLGYGGWTQTRGYFLLLANRQNSQGKGAAFFTRAPINFKQTIKKLARRTIIANGHKSPDAARGAVARAGIQVVQPAQTQAAADYAVLGQQ